VDGDELVVGIPFVRRCRATTDRRLGLQVAFFVVGVVEVAVREEAISRVVFRRTNDACARDAIAGFVVGVGLVTKAGRSWMARGLQCTVVVVAECVLAKDVGE
jgi:hypothetical protein